ncbi:hypothetical protein EKG40_32290, partial [Pseudomonas moorei]
LESIVGTPPGAGSLLQDCVTCAWVHSRVGASLLAMVVNDYAYGLDKRGALESIVGTPPGAGSLLQDCVTC